MPPSVIKSRPGSRAAGSTTSAAKAPPPSPQITVGLEAMSELKERLEQNLSKVVDLFHEWDTNDDGKCSKKEFQKGMQTMGWDIEKDTVDALFNFSTQPRPPPPATRRAAGGTRPRTARPRATDPFIARMPPCNIPPTTPRTSQSTRRAQARSSTWS